MSKQIVIKIDTLGKPKIEAKGFVGTSCQDATAGIERVFQSGKQKKDDVKFEAKDELYQSESESSIQIFN